MQDSEKSIAHWFLCIPIFDIHSIFRSECVELERKFIFGSYFLHCFAADGFIGNIHKLYHANWELSFELSCKRIVFRNSSLELVRILSGDSQRFARTRFSAEKLIWKFWQAYRNTNFLQFQFIVFINNGKCCWDDVLMFNNICAFQSFVKISLDLQVENVQLPGRLLC